MVEQNSPLSLMFAEFSINCVGLHLKVKSYESPFLIFALSYVCIEHEVCLSCHHLTTSPPILLPAWVLFHFSDLTESPAFKSSLLILSSFCWVWAPGFCPTDLVWREVPLPRVPCRSSLSCWLSMDRVAPALTMASWRTITPSSSATPLRPGSLRPLLSTGRLRSAQVGDLSGVSAPTYANQTSLHFKICWIPIILLIIGVDVASNQLHASPSICCLSPLYFS